MSILLNAISDNCYARARALALPVRAESPTRFCVPSASAQGSNYHVTVDEPTAPVWLTCDCEAARHGRACHHVARVVLHLAATDGNANGGLCVGDVVDIRRPVFEDESFDDAVMRRRTVTALRVGADGLEFQISPHGRWYEVWRAKRSAA